MTSVTGSAEAAFRRHYGDVYRYLRRRTGDHHEAEELTQRVFADAAASLDGAETPLAWLYTVARRRFADQARRSGRPSPRWPPFNLSVRGDGESG